MRSTCEFCKQDFSNIYILKKHQNTAKYCLNIQQKSNTSYKCKGCNNTLSTKNRLKTHEEKCVVLLKSTYNEEIKRRDNELINIKEGYEMKLNLSKKKHSEEIVKLEQKYLLQIEKLQDRIQELATRAIEKPTQQVVKTTNNTTNNVLNLTPLNLDKEDFKTKIESEYNLQYLLKGKRGVAEFTREKLLLDESGKSRYVCVDPARHIFKYVDENGETRRDVKASKLTSKVAPDIVDKAGKIVVEERNNKENYKQTVDQITDIYFGIKELKDNPDKLGVELSKLTCD